MALAEPADDAARGDLRVVDRAEAVCRATFPYIPGLFTFREVPPLLDAFARLDTVPDVILFDGHGLAHPRRFGLACHAGLLLDTPSVGCAKSRLVGEFREPGPERGRRSGLKYEGQTVGAVLRTRTGVRPLFISPGHLVDIPGSVRLVLRTTAGFRIPEPLRRADALSRAAARSAKA
jgi:deoxyribonuclease V